MSESSLPLGRPLRRQTDMDPNSVPLSEIDVADSELFENDTHWGYFERLRREEPVHYCAESAFGPYWSVTTYDDIVHVAQNPQNFSSAAGIVVGDADPNFPLKAGFITMDGAEHDAHRGAVQPVLARSNLMKLESTIRERVAQILDDLPCEESFDWVDLVSTELVTGMLATLLGFPYEERRKLAFWSDIATSSPSMAGTATNTEAERKAALLECLEVFTSLRRERSGYSGDAPHDLVTALASHAATKGSDEMEFLGNIILLIVGGNDTTRNSLTGGVLALNEWPDQYRKLRDDPAVIPNMVCEIIRWQTPLLHMRRTAVCDTELHGRSISKGDKVLMWYVSANRDDSAIHRADEFLIDRDNPRKHLSFGWGPHFCMGSRLAEMQLRIAWEEILKRFRNIEVVAPPVRVRSNFVRGYRELLVRVQRW